MRVFQSHCDECHCDGCYSDECHSDECHSDECHSADCHGALMHWLANTIKLLYSLFGGMKITRMTFKD